jgi:RNA polymerase sigma-70 factor (ECF subfamily)
LSSFNGTLENNSTAPDNRSDGEIMLALQGGQDKALDALMRRYKQPLFHFVTRYTRDEDTSYDIVQETFFRVYQKAESFNPA